jgi:hypothetical protein
MLFFGQTTEGQGSELAKRFLPSPLTHMVVTREGEGVVLDLAHDTFFGLSPVATAIWERLAQGQPPREIAHALCRRYRLEETQILSDLGPFLRTMEQHGLLEHCDEQQAQKQTQLVPDESVLRAVQARWADGRGTVYPAGTEQMRAWQNPELREAFTRLHQTDALLKQMGWHACLRALMTLPVHRTAGPDDPEVLRLASAVREAAEWEPFEAACLHQCCALAWMLRQRGVHVDVVLGVYTYPFSAHVWLESAGQPVQWRAGMGYAADRRRLEAMSILFHSGQRSRDNEEEGALAP